MLRKTYWIYLLPLLLGGCALPPVWSVASLFADGVSYAVSSKSVGDNALSELTGADCGVRNFIGDGVYCRDRATVVVATLAERGGDDMAPGLRYVRGNAVWEGGLPVDHTEF